MLTPWPWSARMRSLIRQRSETRLGVAKGTLPPSPTPAGLEEAQAGMGTNDALDAARKLAVVAGVHADESEQRRRMAPAIVAAFIDSELPKLAAPTALGGGAAHPTTVLEVIEEISSADASAGWCVAIGLGSNYLAGIIPESSAAEVFGDLRQPAAGPFAPGGRAQVTSTGYRVSGRWPYASGCHDVGVSASGIMAFEGGRPAEFHPDGSPVVRLGFLTADQFIIEDTWHTVGMRGTGSHHITAADLDLPRERVGTLWDPMWPHDAIYRMRPFDLLGPCLAAVPLAVGRSALDIIEGTARDQAVTPPPPGPRRPLGEDPVAQMQLVEAETRLRSARLLLFDAVNASYEHAEKGDLPPRAVTALIGLACFEAIRAGSAAVDAACALSGSAAIQEGALLDRKRRDIQTAATHVMFSPRIAAGLGRQLAGIHTIAYPFLPV